MAWPDIVGFYDMLYGTAGVDYESLVMATFGTAAGLVFQGNPPYTVTDFLGMYPKFFGPASPYSNLTITNGSADVTGITDLTGLAVGQLVVSPAFPDDIVISAINTITKTVTMSQSATSDGTTITVYQQPFVPILAAINFVFLANACVMYGRYFEMWPQMMAWFVAHFMTMYLRTESGANATAAQVAASGLTKGILVHRAAGDVSATSQLIQGYEGWGAWAETEYGVQFISFARASNCGPIFVQ